MGNVKKITSEDQLYIFSKTGVVVGQQNWAETSVTGSSSGGGGSVHGGSGHVSSPTLHISSSTRERQRIFIQENDGDEFEIDINDPGFGSREGHRLSVIYAGDKDSRRGHLMAIANHSTKQKNIFFDRANWIINQGSTLGGCLIIFFLPIFVPFVLTIIFGIGIIFFHQLQIHYYQNHPMMIPHGQMVFSSFRSQLV